MPWYSGRGSDSIGYRFSRDQLKVPPSTIKPPIELPCPPRNFVNEWTTMSAPYSIGLHRYGVASVLSTIRGTPALLAIFATASMSTITPPGLAIDSMKIALVFGLIARSKVEMSSGSAQTTFQAKFLKA